MRSPRQPPSRERRGWRPSVDAHFCLPPFVRGGGPEEALRRAMNDPHRIHVRTDERLG